MRQKGFRKIIILSSTLVIIIVALIILLPKPIYWYPDNQTTPISSKPISKYQNKISNGIYTNDFAGFSIKPPIGWKIVETQNWIGFGPQEIEEDVIWGISFNDKTTNNESILNKENIGKQFPDRKQSEIKITIDGLKAGKIITTTSQDTDWYSEIIFIDNGNMEYVITNGSMTDKTLNDIILRKSGNNYHLGFEDFYSSFRIR